MTSELNLKGKLKIHQNMKKELKQQNINENELFVKSSRLNFKGQSDQN